MGFCGAVWAEGGCMWLYWVEGVVWGCVGCRGLYVAVGGCMGL